MALINLVLIWLMSFLRYLFQGLYFLIFLSLIFSCNFADDNALFFCRHNLSVILKILEYAIKIFLIWFNLNSLKANPWKFSIYYYLLSLGPQYCFIIGTINVKESDHVQLLGIAIDKYLSFKKHIENLCSNGNYKLYAVRHIRKYLTAEKAKLLGKVFIDRQFKYASLIWMFCQKTIYFQIEKIHHKTLRIIHQANASYHDLLERNGSTSIHQQIFQFSLKEIYKSTVATEPKFIWDFFLEKKVLYSLRKGVVLLFSPARSVTYGKNSHIS